MLKAFVAVAVELLVVQQSWNVRMKVRHSSEVCSEGRGRDQQTLLFPVPSASARAEKMCFQIGWVYWKVLSTAPLAT